jgi:regulator of sigma E protease
MNSIRSPKFSPRPTPLVPYRGSMVRAVLTALAAFPILGFTLLGSITGTEKVVLFIVGFGSVIFVHELGHFLTAKYFKVRCDVFSMGIGPRLCGWRRGVGFTFGRADIGPPMLVASVPTTGGAVSGTGAQADASTSARTSAGPIGETDYRISWLPFGGYVRMLGQDDMDPAKVSEDPASFGKKPIWQRMIIISAGVTMNLIFAVLIFAFIFRVGVNFPPAVVGELAWNSPAAKAGLQIGDRVVSINHRPPQGFLEFTQLAMAAALDTGDAKISLEYVKPHRKTIHNVSITPVADPNNGMLSFGIGQMLSLRFGAMTPRELKDFITALPQYKGIQSRDLIIAIDSIPVHGFAHFYKILQQCNGNPVTLTLESHGTGKIHQLTIQPTLETRDWVNHFPRILGMKPRCRVVMVEPGTPAAKVGIRRGDIVVRVNASAHPTISNLQRAVRENPGRQVLLQVLRGSKVLTFHPTVSAKGLLGVGLGYDFAHPVIAAVSRRAAAAGILPGRTITSMVVPGGPNLASGGIFPIKNWFDIVTLGRRFSGQAIDLSFTGHHRPVQLTISNHDARELSKLKYAINLPLSALMQLQKSHSIVGAAKMGFGHTMAWIVRTYQTLFGLVGRTVPVSQLHSVLGIVKIGYTIESRGFTYLLFFLGLISVNLAVINFLPLPIVDGGLFLMLIVEKIRGKPLPVQVQTAIQTVGIVLLVAAFLFITIHNDLPMFFGH